MLVHDVDDKGTFWSASDTGKRYYYTTAVGKELAHKKALKNYRKSHGGAKKSMKKSMKKGMGRKRIVKRG